MSNMQELTHEARVLLPSGRRKAMWFICHRNEGIVFKEVWPRYERSNDGYMPAVKPAHQILKPPRRQEESNE